MYFSLGNEYITKNWMFNDLLEVVIDNNGVN